MPESIKSPLILAGRVLLALMFVLAGYRKLTHLEGTANYIAAGGLPAPGLLAVLVGLFELCGGLALALGFKARWAALALGLFTLIASLMYHRFWAVAADQQSIQYLLFMKNMAVAGGMFIVAAWGAGPLRIDHRGAPKPR
jgi:putative oxidoreductase